MVGPITIYHCALCSESFTSRIVYNRHVATHDEPVAPQLPCPVCSFRFADSYALEVHKAQTGHSAIEHHCDNCGETFQTEVRLKQHRQFPSLCYADAARTHPIRTSSRSQAVQKAPMATQIQTGVRSGYVDLDAPVSSPNPVLPYGNPPDPGSLSSSPSDISGVYCYDCKNNFASQALFTRHCLSCSVRNRPVEQEDTAAYINNTGDATPYIRATPLPDLSGNASSTIPNMAVCRVGDCGKTFESQTALDQHQRDSHIFVCGIDGCRSKFQSQAALGQHKKASHILLCDFGSCGKPFQSQVELDQHKRHVHSAVNGEPAVQDGQPRPASEATVVSIVSSQPSRSPATIAPPPGSALPNANTASLLCGIGGCTKTFRSGAGLSQHKIDSHGVGGQGLDLNGRDSWMLSQNVRNQLRDAGLLRPSRTSQQQPRRPPANGQRSAPLPATIVSMQAPRAPLAAQQTRRDATSAPIPPATASSCAFDVGGPVDIEQANELQGKIMRMLITADIAIRHEGKIDYDGVAWTRLTVHKQNELVGTFDQLVHLRKLSKQGQAKQHVPRPATFETKSIDSYPGSDFKQLPDLRPGSLDVVVICCSKIMLENRCEEVVKVAALDALTGRPLMSYLVCTDPMEAVEDWRTLITGLTGMQDFEAARAQKFKILKGWEAARAALGRFVDQNTIIIGYNLRSDLDALRIRHGRCVDVIKCVEKAADLRPLSKKQLLLDTLLRDLPQIQLRADPTFGRDCLQDAFAVRELAFWAIKHNDQLIKYAKQRSLDYQRVSRL